MRGRTAHTTATGFRKDREKINTATQMGWRVFEFDSQHVKKTNYAIETMKDVLNIQGIMEW